MKFIPSARSAASAPGAVERHLRDAIPPTELAPPCRAPLVQDLDYLPRGEMRWLHESPAAWRFRTPNLSRDSAYGQKITDVYGAAYERRARLAALYTKAHVEAWTETILRRQGLATLLPRV